MILKGSVVGVALGVLLCLVLGTWQLHRLQWKTNLIQRFDEQLHQPPCDIFTFNFLRRKEQQGDNVTTVEKDKVSFQPLKAEGHFDSSLAFKLQGRPLNGKDGYHLIMPFKLKDGSWILVDRGWLPQQTSITSSSMSPQVTIEGYLRWQSDVHFMTPTNVYDQRTLYSVQPLEAATHLKQFYPDLWPFYLVQTSTLALETGVTPECAKKQLSVRNSHFQYALTWYSLAVVLLAFYGISVKSASSKTL